jgi:hypothetical protein
METGFFLGYCDHLGIASPFPLAHPILSNKDKTSRQPRKQEGTDMETSRMKSVPIRNKSRRKLVDENIIKDVKTATRTRWRTITMTSLEVTAAFTVLSCKLSCTTLWLATEEKQVFSAV